MTNEELEAMAHELSDNDMFTSVTFFKVLHPTITLDGSIYSNEQAQQLVEFLTAAYNLGE